MENEEYLPYHQRMKVMGIDPGLAKVGVGVLEGGRRGVRLLDLCTIETAANLTAPERLQELRGNLRVILQEFHPEIAVIERIFFARNQRTVIDVAQARGVLLFAVQEEGIAILEPTPLELKLAVTGDGKADKQQIQRMLHRTLRLPEGFFRGTTDDATDALALALFGVLTIGAVTVRSSS
jgi:crossover junction endodeoxyribonuclease RuvC